MEKTVAMAIVILLLASAVGAVGYLGYKTYAVAKAKKQTGRELARKKLIAQYRKRVLERRAKRAAEAEAQAQAQAEELQRRLKLATIRKGEGVEHAFIRQLIDDPNIMDGVKIWIGKKEYDLEFAGGDDEAVKKWARSTAHLLAIFTGYIDRKTGRQIMVKRPNEIAYLVDVDENKKSAGFDVYQKEAKAAEAEFVYQTHVSISWSGGEATFWADVKDGMVSFEYVWKPAKVKKQQKK